MSITVTGQNNALIVTGAKPPVLHDIGLPSKGSEPLKPRPPQGSRALRSAHSAKSSRQNLNERPNVASLQLSPRLFFRANYSEMPRQVVPISVVIDANLPKTAVRKQSVIFSPRKDGAQPIFNPARVILSRGGIEKSLSMEDVSTFTISNSPRIAPFATPTDFQVDAIPATLTPRPLAPVAPAFSAMNVRPKPKSPRIAKKVLEPPPADSGGQSNDPQSAPAVMDLRMRMKRRVADFDVGALDVSFLPEEIRRMHGIHTLDQNIATATPDVVAAEVSHAETVNKLEDRVLETMNQSQFDKNVLNRMVIPTTASSSSLKFAFPHSSPAQIFISTQPSIRLGESATKIAAQKPKPSAPLNSNSMPSGAHPSPVIYADHAAELKGSSSDAAQRQASPRQRGAFFVQDHAFVLKDVCKSNSRTPGRQNTQAPILFNQIGPKSNTSSVHDSRAAAAALTALAIKPQQAQQTSADHQQLHMMCNNRIPDFFLAAMHRR